MRKNESISVCFLPFWEPHYSYASSRLRAVFPARALSKRDDMVVSAGWVDDAQVYFVVQLCSDRMLGRLAAAKARGARIAYVVCDRHFAATGSLAGVSPKWRFAQLSELADLFVVPTSRMQEIVRQRDATKPIAILPDWRDYIEFEDPTPVPISANAAWFGNPGTGNFAAARPYLIWLRDSGFHLSIISRKDSFQSDIELQRYVHDWQYSTFVARLRERSLSIIAFAPDESQKSENRLVTSIMNGVPSIVAGASSSADALNANGLAYAVVAQHAELMRAVNCLSKPQYRNDYMVKMQAHLADTYSDDKLSMQYVNVIKDLARK